MSLETIEATSRLGNDRYNHHKRPFVIHVLTLLFYGHKITLRYDVALIR